MSTTCLSVMRNDYAPEPQDDVADSIFQEYEHVIVESIITSFGLDFLFFSGKDQYGGDVDTILNVRQIGSNKEMVYKNASNQVAYENRGEYVSAKYHGNTQYIEKNREISVKKKAGELIDAYTGKRAAPNAKIDLDHEIAAKEIHDDPGRVLAGLCGIDLANSPENLQPTDRSINRSMKAKSAEEYLAWLKETEVSRNARIKELKSKEILSDKESSELQKLEKQNLVNPEKLMAADAKARKAYDAKINRAYYTSPRFAKDTVKAAGKVGLQMGLRQAFGFVFLEVWFEVKSEFEQVKAPFDMEHFLLCVGNGVRRGIENAKMKYHILFEKLGDGVVAGALASLSTTLCNIFITTAKNTVRIIRQAWASVTEATKILLFNPDNLLYGERFRATTKILAVGGSVVVGRLVDEMVAKSAVGVLPVVGEVVQNFCGILTTGIMSCTLLYFLDRSVQVNKLVSLLNQTTTIETAICGFAEQARLLECFAAELLNIDLKEFQKETILYHDIADELEHIRDAGALNSKLYEIFERIGIQLPWVGDFDLFMSNKSKTLVFE